MRHTHPVLRRGTFESLYAEDMVYVCRRQLDDVEALVVLNAGQEPSTFTLEGASKPTNADVWRDDSPVSVEREGLTLTVPPRDAAVLVGR
ncbi:MAG: alpha-glucosidase C-terminal domain-containing protein [Anaerolineae bacterium]